MYSQELQTFLEEISNLGDIDPRNVSLLRDTVSCYLQVFSKSIGGNLQSEAQVDFLGTSLNLLCLSMALSELDENISANGSHYLVAMGLEQSGELLARRFGKNAIILPPLQNDYWYRLALAFLHYMAGRFRVQSLSVLRHLRDISEQAKDGPFRSDYARTTQALSSLFNGRLFAPPYSEWESFLFGETRPSSA